MTPDKRLRVYEPKGISKPEGFFTNFKLTGLDPRGQLAQSLGQLGYAVSIHYGTTDFKGNLIPREVMAALYIDTPEAHRAYERASELSVVRAFTHLSYGSISDFRNDARFAGWDDRTQALFLAGHYYENAELFRKAGEHPLEIFALDLARQALQLTDKDELPREFSPESVASDMRELIAAAITLNIKPANANEINSLPPQEPKRRTRRTDSYLK